MIYWLRLIRLPELFLLCLYFCLSVFIWNSLDISTSIDIRLVLLSIASLIPIAIGLFILNDIAGQEADAVNHPEALLIGQKIAKTHALKGSIAALSLGMIATFFMAIHLSRAWPAILVGLVISICVSYNQWLKSVPFLGNILLAFLRTLPLLLPLLLGGISTELLWSMTEMSVGLNYLILIFLFYLLSLYREIFKDLRDIEGHASANVKTAAVRFGRLVPQVTATVIGILVITLIIVLMGMEWTADRPIALLFLFCFVLVPFAISLAFGSRGVTAFEFSKACMWSRHTAFTSVAYVVLLCYLVMR